MIQPPKGGFVKLSCLKTPYEDLLTDRFRELMRWKTGRARQRELAILKGPPMKKKKPEPSLKVRLAREIVIVGFELFHAKEALVTARQAVVNAEGDVNFLWLKAAKLRDRWEALKRTKVAKKAKRA